MALPPRLNTFDETLFTYFGCFRGETPVKGNHAFLFNGAFNQNKLKSTDQVRGFCRPHSSAPQDELSFSVTDHFATERAAIDSGEILFHPTREQ